MNTRDLQNATLCALSVQPTATEGVTSVQKPQHYFNSIRNKSSLYVGQARKSHLKGSLRTNKRQLWNLRNVMKVNIVWSLFLNPAFCNSQQILEPDDDLSYT